MEITQIPGHIFLALGSIHTEINVDVASLSEALRLRNNKRKVNKSAVRYDGCNFSAAEQGKYF